MSKFEVRLQKAFVIQRSSRATFVIRHSSFPRFDPSSFVVPELLAMLGRSHYCQCLKALSAAVCIASAILAAGCADPLEKPIGEEAGEKFKRGITGGGTLVPIDPSNDPSINPPPPEPPRP